MTKNIANIPEIWAVGGGKGGTGKSFLACNIATNLAQKGKKVVIIDADFGGPNLHTFLNASKQAGTLTDFFSKRATLNELIVKCCVKNMGVIVGPVRSFEPDSIPYAQKVKLFRHIKKIPADIVILDLGAGSHFNIIDSFLLADKKIVVALPHLTSMENMYSFLKNSFFRRLMRVFVENKMQQVFKNTIQNRREYKLGNMQQLISFLKGSSGTARQIVDKELSSFNINIVVNQARTNQDIHLGNAIKSVCIKYLGFNAQCVGYLEYDETVPMTINKQQPYMQIYPKSKCTAKIDSITENLLHNRQMRIKL